MSDRILVDHDIFLGRIDEQQRFRVLLDELLLSSRKGLFKKHFSIPTEWSYVVLLYGAGGMGKTTLSKRLRDIVRGIDPDHDYLNKFTPIWIDWETQRDRDHRLAVRDTVTFEAILDHLYSAFREASFTHEFSQFEQERSRLKELETRVDHLLNTHPEDSDHYASLRKLGSVGLTTLVRMKLPDLGVLLPQEEMSQALEEIFTGGAEGIKHLRTQANEWLHRHLKNDEHDLFAFPREHLARAFAQGMRDVTRSKPLTMFLDTYEIIDQADRWLRLIMSQSGRRAVWVLSGRNNLVESRRYGQYYFIGYQGETPADRLRVFPLSEFSQEDIKIYFAEKAPARSINSEQAIAIQHATYGIPLAVKTAAALWTRAASLETITENLPERADRETIVRIMTDRLLVHARADFDHSFDVTHLYALALVYLPDYELLTALWGVQSVRQILDDLERRYDFVFAHRMRLHDSVRDFLREYLLAEVERRGPDIQSMTKRAIAHLEQRLTDSHQRLKTLEARLEDDRWVNDILALTWHRFWLDEKSGWKTLQITFFAALAYNRKLADALLNVADFFSSTMTQSYERRLAELHSILSSNAIAKDERAILNALELALSGEEFQPDEGCITEYSAVVAWLRGRTSYRQGQLRETLGFWFEAARQLPDNVQSLKIRISSELTSIGVELEQKPEYREEAITAFNQAIKLNPRSSRPWHNLGHIYEEQGLIEDAINAFDQARRLDPKQPNNWRCLSDLYSKQQQLDKAINALQSAIEIDKDKENQAIYWTRIGNLYHKQDRLEEATKALKDAIALDPNIGTAWEGLGYIYEEQGQLEYALAAFQKAKRNSEGKNRVRFLSKVGDLYFKLNRLKDAKLNYNQAKSIDPNDGNIWHSLGHIYEQERQLEEAIAAFKRAGSIEPDLPNHLSCLARVYVKKGQADKALTAFLQSIEKAQDPTTLAELWHQVSELYRKQHRLDDAIRAAEQILTFEPESAIYWVYLGDLYRKHNLQEKAVDAYIKGTDLPSQSDLALQKLAEVRQFLEVVQDKSSQ